MMPGIVKVLERVAKDNGLVWEKTLAEWKSKGQWHVEVRENLSYDVRLSPVWGSSKHMWWYAFCCFSSFAFLLNGVVHYDPRLFHFFISCC